LVQITVDEKNVKELYPNYRFNWDAPEEFMEHLTNNLETPMEEEGVAIDFLKEYGYSIRVLSRDEAKLLSI
jgi:hypothetical protein